MICLFNFSSHWEITWISLAPAFFHFEDFDSSTFLSPTFFVWTLPCSVISIDKRSDKQWYVCPLSKWFTRGYKCWPSSVLRAGDHMTHIYVFDLFSSHFLKEIIGCLNSFEKALDWTSTCLNRTKKRYFEKGNLIKCENHFWITKHFHK